MDVTIPLAGFCHESSLRSISIMPRGPKGNGQTRRVSSTTHRAPGRFIAGFPWQASECSAIHLAASCSVTKPLITSVSPSGHRISIAQPVPGFFRTKKVGRSSNILRICACGGPVQDSYPAAIKLPIAGPDCASRSQSAHGAPAATRRRVPKESPSAGLVRESAQWTKRR